MQNQKILNPNSAITSDKQALMTLIKTEREKRNFSQSQLAEKMKVSQSRIAHMESPRAAHKVSYDAIFKALETLGFHYRVIPYNNESLKKKEEESHIIIRGNLSKNIAGFSMENKEANQGGQIKVLIKGFFTSQTEDFHKIADNVATFFLFRSIKGLTASSLSSIYNYLVLLNEEGKYELHIGMPVLFEGLAKRDFKVGEGVSYSDLAAIRRVRFPTIVIPPRTGIIYFFSEGYQHGLYIDLTPYTSNEPIVVDDLERDLAIYLQQMAFEHHFKNDTIISKMEVDGWFRFSAIPKELFDQLYAFYNDPNIQDKVSIARNYFSCEKLNKLIDKWEKKEIFKDHMGLVRASFDAFKSGNYPAAISTLYPRIEGVLRAMSKGETSDPTLPWLIKRLRKAGTEKAGSKSLLFPKQFQQYLSTFLCKEFNFESGNIEFSRHSHSHGVLNADEYTHERAIIGYLILDHISYYV